MELKAKIWITHHGGIAFGKGRAQLLDAIEKTGSISAAARLLGLSYRHAWSMLESSERLLRRSLVERTRGGRRGGGARITPYAARLLEKYRSIGDRFSQLAREESHELDGIPD
jgi:molybdate transport system regulatory protein